MNYTEFLKRLRVKAEKEKDIRVWHVIHSYICKRGQTDRYDRDLQKDLEASLGKWVSESELKRQLGAMEKFGLLRGHKITVKYTDLGKAMLPLGLFFNHDGPPAGAFLRYTLPGMIPTLNLQREKKKKKKPIVEKADTNQGSTTNDE